MLVDEYLDGMPERGIDDAVDVAVQLPVEEVEHRFHVPVRDMEELMHDDLGGLSATPVSPIVKCDSRLVAMRSRRCHRFDALVRILVVELQRYPPALEVKPFLPLGNYYPKTILIHPGTSLSSAFKDAKVRLYLIESAGDVRSVALRGYGFLAQTERQGLSTAA